MADTFSKGKRSAIMRIIKGKENQSTEIRLIQIFKENGIKSWRRNYPVIGKPDFIFPNKKIAVFADGCFWHGHHCRNIVPKHNTEYWDKKRQRNIDRDTQITKLFTERGWTVLRFWECNIKKGNLDLTPLAGKPKHKTHRNFNSEKSKKNTV